MPAPNSVSVFNAPVDLSAVSCAVVKPVSVTVTLKFPEAYCNDAMPSVKLALITVAVIPEGLTILSPAPKPLIE